MTDAEPPAPVDTARAPVEPASGPLEPAAPAMPPHEIEAEGPRPVDYDPPWREARRRVGAAWSRGGTGTRVTLVVGGAVAAGLLGAFLFGLWHVVVGGLVKGNWNAAGFGFALSSVTGVLLWIEASFARRLLPAAGTSGPGVRS